MSSAQGQACYPEPLRRVNYRDPETGKEYVFVTNRLDLSALEAAELYRRRWQIELFFRWIKQNLKIKAFYGTSRNAVLIRIWTALIAYLLLVWVKFKTKAGWGLLELTRLAQTMLLERMIYGPCSVFDHQTTDNPCYSISVPDSSDDRYLLRVGVNMGRLFEFGCEKCGYQAEVSGGDDAGYLIVT